MSIRRKSCNPCFGARRKCDLTYPICRRCQKLGKECQYAYPPQLSVIVTGTTPPDAAAVSSARVLGPSLRRKREGYKKPFHLVHYGNSQGHGPQLLREPTLPPDYLNEHTVYSENMGWTWLFNQIRTIPLVFATQAETVFIHKSLYNDTYPRPLRAAFGICAGCVSLNERNRSVLFQALDDQVSELLTPALKGSLAEDLVTLQAVLLYETIRLFYGGPEARAVAESQEYAVRTYALKLLQRANAELGITQQTWESWILAESVRRTVVMLFKVYTTYSSFRRGRCEGSTALQLLPVSTRSTWWSSREAYPQIPYRDETMIYKDFTSFRPVVPQPDIDLFDKLLLVGYMGNDQFEAMVGSSSVAN